MTGPQRQIGVMAKIVARLEFAGFAADAFQNPDLQKHYKNLEALALDKDVPEDHVDITGACCGRMSGADAPQSRTWSASRPRWAGCCASLAR